MWVFWRALSLHLQICWEVVPGRAFFYSALAFGWGIPAVALALALSLTGVSFRFGNVCHINHANGLQVFWGPLLAFAAGSLIIQAITFGYCIHVYVKSLFDDNPTTDVSSGLPSYSGSVRTRTARQAFRRVKKVIQLQWRGVVVVLIIIAEVIFFAVVFVSMDNNLMATESEPEKARPWLLCLASSRGDKNQCLHLAHEMVEKESTILAVLVCLAVSHSCPHVFRPNRIAAERLLGPSSSWPLVHGTGVGGPFQETFCSPARICLCRCQKTLQQRPSAVRNAEFGHISTTWNSNPRTCCNESDFALDQPDVAVCRSEVRLLWTRSKVHKSINEFLFPQAPKCDRCMGSRQGGHLSVNGGCLRS